MPLARAAEGLVGEWAEGPTRGRGVRIHISCHDRPGVDTWAEPVLSRVSSSPDCCSGGHVPCALQRPHTRPVWPGDNLARQFRPCSGIQSHPAAEQPPASACPDPKQAAGTWQRIPGLWSMAPAAPLPAIRVFSSCMHLEASSSCSEYPMGCTPCLDVWTKARRGSSSSKRKQGTPQFRMLVMELERSRDGQLQDKAAEIARSHKDSTDTRPINGGAQGRRV